MLIDKTEIRRLIPHTGTMCLLDGVEAWDHHSIVCISNSHRQPDNPLRRHGRLAAVHGLEYGAQSMALHGALLAETAGQKATIAYLAAVRDVRLQVDFLDDAEEPLEIVSRQLLGEHGNSIYLCRLGVSARCLIEARITVMIGTNPIA